MNCCVCSDCAIRCIRTVIRIVIRKKVSFSFSHLEYKCLLVHDLADHSKSSCQVKYLFFSPEKLAAWCNREVLLRYLKLNCNVLLWKLFNIYKATVKSFLCLQIRILKSSKKQNLLHCALFLTPNFLYLHRFPWSFPLYCPLGLHLPPSSAILSSRSIPRKFAQ